MQGCISNPFTFKTRSTDVEVNSQPSGAEVFVLEKSVGTTPVKISFQTLYPTVYDHELQDLYGAVVIKKEGCNEYKKRVHRASLEAGKLNVKLDCEADRERARYRERYDDYRYRNNRYADENLRERDIKRMGVSPVIPAQQDRMNSSLLPSMEERINRVNKLRKDGLITEKEYKAARKRMLEQL